MTPRWWLLLFLGAVLPAADLAPRFTDARCGDLLEWEVRAPDPAWLVSDTARTPVLEIDAPDGSAWNRAAFLWQEGRADHRPEATEEYVAIGERGLRIRHTARVAGVHRWRLRTADGAKLADGAFTVVAATGPLGPIRANPANPRLLAFADGTPWIPIGPNIAWAKPDRLERFERYFARLAAAGGTHARTWLASWCLQFEGEKPDEYRLGQAWLLDQVLARARAHGIRLTLVIDNHHDLVHGKMLPYGETYVDRATAFLAATPGAQYERKLRYLLARWGADDTVACWELFNEVDMACMVREIALPWIAGASALFMRLDQDHRLATVSWVGGDWPRAADAGRLPLVQLHGYVLEWTLADEAHRTAWRDAVGGMAVDSARAIARNQPFLWGEVGYQGTEEVNYGNDLDRDGMLLRQTAWAGFLLGGAGSGMHWWWDVYIEDANLWDQYRGLASAVQRIDWRDRALAPLTPNADGDVRVIGWLAPTQALLWPHPRADTWHRRLIEQQPRPLLPAPRRVTLSGLRPSARFAVTHLDQITGAEKAREEATADAQGRLVLTIPRDCLDLVLHLKAE